MFAKIKSIIYMIKSSRAHAQGNELDTLHWLEKSCRTGAAKPSIVTTYGYLLLKNGRLEEAMKVLADQLRSPSLSNMDVYVAQSNYALGLWKQGKLDKAIAMLEKTIPHYKNTNVYGSLGYLYNLQGDLEKALAFNLEAKDYNATGPVILDNLGQTYYLMGDQEKATEVFEKCLSLNPQFPEAYYDYALVCEKLGNIEKSIELLNKAKSYKINFLSAISKEDIDKKLAALGAE